MTQLGDTQPVRPNQPPNELAPPPRILMWAMTSILVIGVVGAIAGIYIFREVVPPRYQFVATERFPVLSILLPQRAAPGDTLPTPIPQTQEGGISVDDLLNAPVSLPTTAGEVTTEGSEEAAPTAEPTREEEASAGVAVVVAPTATPIATATTVPTDIPTPTLLPPTATTLPPTPAPTQQTVAQAAVDADVVSASTNSILPAPAAARLYGFQTIKQTWNNCGPANTTMTLSYFGWREDQTYAQSFMRGGREDKNVNPWEIETFVNEQSGVRAMYRVGGDLNLLKRLLAADLPVIIELGYMPEGDDWLGHYQTVVGYDDAAGSLYVLDTYIGAGPDGTGLAQSYTDVQRNWQHFNYTFIVFYEASREPELLNILGPRATLEESAEHALEIARSEARQNPQNGHTWFNIGTSLTMLERYDEAAVAYDEARRLGLPWRMLWYQFGPFEAYYETGRYQDVLALVEANLTTLGNGYVEETHYWQGRTLQAMGEANRAQSAYQRALQQNSRFTAARDALETL